MNELYIDWRAGPDGDGDSEGGEERGVATKVRPKTKKPSMWRVILMNDDYTPMEFVVSILMGIFKVTQVMDAAKRAQHPLQCTLEKE